MVMVMTTMGERVSLYSLVLMAHMPPGHVQGRSGASSARGVPVLTALMTRRLRVNDSTPQTLDLIIKLKPTFACNKCATKVMLLL